MKTFPNQTAFESVLSQRHLALTGEPTAPASIAPVNSKFLGTTNPRELRAIHFQ